MRVGEGVRVGEGEGEGEGVRWRVLLPSVHDGCLHARETEILGLLLVVERPVLHICAFISRPTADM